MTGSWLTMLFLAVLQGITEFLPVSSSGHLVLAQHSLGVNNPGLLLELVLHAGSLAAIILFFRRRLMTLAISFFSPGGDGRRYAAVIVLGTIPAATIGLLFSEPLTRKFESPLATGIFLLVTGLILLSSRLRPRTDCMPVTWRRGLTIGFSQALAILPGISRSGTTITTARRLGMSPEDAAEFSFILSIPVLAGGSLLILRDWQTVGENGWPPSMLISGLVVSAIVSYAALHGLLRILKSGLFWIFGIYCLLAGTVALIRF